MKLYTLTVLFFLFLILNLTKILFGASQRDWVERECHCLYSRKLRKLWEVMVWLSKTVQCISNAVSNSLSSSLLLSN